MDISVIIVSYNVRYYLQQCLESVWASAKHSGLDVEVYVVDNASSDDSVAYIREQFPAEQYPTLHLVGNRANVGFGRANNQALRKAEGKYILFLNPDTIITENTLRQCYDFAETKDRVGAIGVKMLNVNGSFALESRRGLPTPWVSFCKMSGLGRIFPYSRVFGRYYMRYLSLDEPTEIEIVSGAFMFCSHAALNVCEGFDEQFFMYGEDVDLSYRFMKAGFKNYYYPTSIVHYKGESTHKGSYRYVHIFYEAMLIFFQKHFATASFVLSIPVKCAILGQACLALLKQKVRSFMYYVHPSIDNKIQRLKYFNHDKYQPELVELATLWGLEMKEDNADIVAFNVEDMTYAQILEELEGSNTQVGMYYPSRQTLIVLSGIYSV